MKTRRLSAIMFTDIVGYTAIMQENESEGLSKVRRYSRVMEEQVKAHHGEILQFQGDGSLSIFHSAVEAMYAAQAIQEQMQQDPVIPLRIGIHIGDIVIQDGAIYGDGVNLASRVESMGVPGSVLVTEQVIPNLKSHPEFSMTSLGKFLFKNVEEPMEVFALTNEGFPVPRKKELQGKFRQKENPVFPRAWLVLLTLLFFALSLYFIFQPSQVVQHSEPIDAFSIAVLPFHNMNKDEEGELFCAGMQEDILTSLAHIKDLKVISRTSALHYKDSKKKIPEIAAELGVAHIVEGSVRKYGSKARITVQLIRAADDVHLWAENYDRDLKDIFAVQSEVSQKIVSALQVNITQLESDKMEAPMTTNPEAYEYFLKGKRSADDRTKEGLAESVHQLEEAIDLDQNFAEAYANMAYSKFLQGRYNYEDPETSNEEAEKWATKAIELDAENTLAYSVLGGVKQVTGKLSETKEYIAKALKISPNDVFPHHALGQYYAETGEVEKEMEHRRKVLDLDPLIEVYHQNYLEGLIKQDLTEEARKQLKKMESLFPKNKNKRGAHKAMIYIREGDYPKASRELQKHIRENPQLMGPLGYSYAQTGKIEEAKELLGRLDDEEGNFHKELAMIYMGLGDEDEAIDELEDFVDERKGTKDKSFIRAILLNQPYFRSLKGNPEFEEIFE